MSDFLPVRDARAAAFLPLRTPAALPSPSAARASNSGPAASRGTPRRAGTAGAGSASPGAESADAARQFKAILLMELMKPLTSALASSGLSGDEPSSQGDVYSYFWNEALAGKLAGNWPLPRIEDLLGSTEMPGSGLDGGVAGILSRAGLPGSAAASVRAYGAGTSEATGAAGATGNGAGAGATGSSSAVAPAAASGLTGAQETPPSERGVVDTLITRASRLFSLPVNLVRAVVHVESSGRAEAVSPKGAIGLMQLMPDTAREMGIRDPHDLWENLYAGAKYLSRQLDRFGTVEKALAAYNAGPSRVEQHDGVPPLPETRAYVRRVLEAKAGLDRSRPQDA